MIIVFVYFSDARRLRYAYQHSGQQIIFEHSSKSYMKSILSQFR